MKSSCKSDLLLLFIFIAIWKSDGASFASTKLPLTTSKPAISPSQNIALLSQPRNMKHCNTFANDHYKRTAYNGRRMDLQANLLLDLSTNIDAIASSDLILAAQSGVLGAATSLHKMMQAGQFLFDSTSTYVSIYMLNSVIADHTNRRILPQIEDLLPTKLSFSNGAQQTSENVILEFDDDIDIFQNSRYVDETQGTMQSEETLNHGPNSRRVNHSFPDPEDDEGDESQDTEMMESENRMAIEIEEDIVVLEDPTPSAVDMFNSEDYYLPSNSNDQDVSTMDCNISNMQAFKTSGADEDLELAKLKERTHRALLEERVAQEKKLRDQVDSTQRNTNEDDLLDDDSSVEASILTDNRQSIWDDDFEVEESEPIIVEDFFICEDSNFSPDECEVLDQEIPTEMNLLDDTFPNRSIDSSLPIIDTEYEPKGKDQDLFFADEVYPDLPMAQGLCDAAFQSEKIRSHNRKSDEYIEKLERDMVDLREHIVQKGVESEISRRRQMAHAEASKLLKKYVEEENEQRSVSKSKFTEDISLVENVVHNNDMLEEDEDDIHDAVYQPNDSYSKLFSPRTKRSNPKLVTGRFRRVRRVGSAALERVLPISTFLPVKKVGRMSSDALESIFPVKTEEVMALAKKREIILTSVAIVFARRLLRIWVGPLFPF